MTQNRALAATTLLSVLAAVLIALVLGPGGQAGGTVQAPAEISMHRIDAVPAAQPLGTGLAAIGGTDGLSGMEQAQVEEAADRICEGFTDGVPVMDMADTLVREQGLTEDTARALIREVAAERC